MFSKNLNVLILIVCIFILAPLAITCRKTEGSSSKAPVDFTLPDLTGKNISLSEYLGKKVVLLAFGATWCPHCVNEVPELKEIYGKFKGKDFILLYIDIGETKKKVESFVKDKGITYTVLLDEKNETASSYKVYGIPYAVLIDKKGEIAFNGTPSKGFLSKKIEELLR